MKMFREKRIAIIIPALTLILLLSINYAAGVTTYEANTLLHSAEVYFDVGDFKNALKNVHHAKDKYDSLGNSTGVMACDNLIIKISNQITDTQKAGYYYSIAADYFTNLPSSIDNYNEAIRFAQLAKEVYERTNDFDGITRTRDLIDRANVEIGRMRNTRRESAEIAYRTAQDLFIEGRYYDARFYIYNSTTLFKDIKDDQGIAKSEFLLRSIDEKIDGTKQNAKASFDRATDLYVGKDLINALILANQSRSLYASIHDEAGLKATSDLMTAIDKEVEMTEADKVRRAEIYYQQAESYLITMDCWNASDAAGDAKNIFIELMSKAKAEKNQDKAKMYEERISETDKLLSRVYGICGEERRKLQAENFYTRAQEFFVMNQNRDALNYAQKAKDIYVELNNYVGMSKADSLISKINDRLKQSSLAKSYLDKAYAYYGVAEYENAQLYAEKAKDIYDTIWDNNKTGECNILLENTKTGAQKKYDADGYFSQAQGYFKSNDFDNSRLYAVKAHEIYKQINFQLGISEATALVRESEKEREKQYIEFRNNVILGVFALIVLAFMLNRWLKNKKLREQTEQKKEDDDAFKLAKDEEELRLRMEEETKTRVEEELKTMISKERERDVFEDEEDEFKRAGAVER